MRGDVGGRGEGNDCFASLASGHCKRAVAKWLLRCRQWFYVNRYLSVRHVWPDAAHFDLYCGDGVVEPGVRVFPRRDFQAGSVNEPEDEAAAALAASSAALSANRSGCNAVYDLAV